MVESNTLAILGVVALVLAIGMDVHKDIRRIVSARNVGLLTLMAWFLYEAITMPEELTKFSTPDGTYYYTQDQYNVSIGYVLLAAGGMLGVYHSSKTGVFDDFASRVYRADRPDILWLVFLLGLAIGVAPLLYASNFDVWYIVSSAFQFGKRWSGRFARSRYGNLADAFMELQMFLKAIVPVAIVLMANRKVSGGKKLFCLGFLAWMIARSVVSGTRSNVLLVLLPVLAAIYWKLKPSTQKFAVAVGLPLAVLVAVQWSAAVVKNRESGEFRWEDAQSAEYVGLEMHRELMYLSVSVPDRMEYRYGHTYFVQLVNPVPRALWPGKPTEDAGLLMARARGEVTADGEPYLTRSPGLVGEMYWNFGVIGILVMSGLLGYVLRSWDRMLEILPGSFFLFVVFAAGLAMIFLSGRSLTMSIYYGMISFYVLLVLMDKRMGTLAEARRAMMQSHSPYAAPMRAQP